jgi:hypothetical protein
MIRTVIVLLLGIFMALVVYAGQSDFGKESRDAGTSASRQIHESQIKGYDFSYRMVQTTEPDSFYREMPYQLASVPELTLADGPENTQLVLFITDAQGRNVVDAKVKYRVSGPGQGILESGGFPLKGGYAAGIYCTQPGVYRIEAEIELLDKKKILVDRFDFSHQPESILN